jgi:hypothetical protein
LFNKIKYIVFVILAALVTNAQAQDFSLAKTYFQEGKLAAAKEQIDGYLESDEGGAAAEAWLLKAAIYARISDDAQTKYLVPDGKKEAYLAIERAVKLNKSLAKRELEKDSFAVLRSIYAGYAAEGVASFNAASEKKSAAGYAQALDLFKNALTINQFAVDQQWVADLRPARPVLQYNAAQTAINGNKEDEALLYSRQLADNRVIAAGSYTATDFYNIYQWLTNYYYIKQDAKNLVQYAGQGATAYPNSTFFVTMLLNGYRQLGDYAHLLEIHEKAVKQFPGQYAFVYAYCADLFAYIYQPDGHKQVKPAFHAKLEAQLKDYIGHQPDSAKGYLLLGKHYFNRAVGMQKAESPDKQILQMLNLAIGQLQMFTQKFIGPRTGIYKEAVSLLATSLNAAGRKAEAVVYEGQLMEL